MGWWFGRQSKGPDAELLERMRVLEASVKGLETEWTSVYQKLSKVLGHITKTNALNVTQFREPEVPPPPPVAPVRSPEDWSRDEIARWEPRA